MGGLAQTVQNVQSLQDQIHELQQLMGDHQIVHDDHEAENSDSCDEDTDHAITDCEESDSEDCGSGHAAGASPPGDGHTHPNSLTAEEHDANCQHSH